MPEDAALTLLACQLPPPGVLHLLLEGGFRLLDVRLPLFEEAQAAPLLPGSHERWVGESGRLRRAPAVDAGTLAVRGQAWRRKKVSQLHYLPDFRMGRRSAYAARGGARGRL